MTSSVMSRTDSPPVVRSCVSCWKTFTVRSPSSVVGGRGSAGRRILRVWPQTATFRRAFTGPGSVAGRVGGRPGSAGVHVLGRGSSARAGAADRDRALHAEALVAVDRTVDLVGPLLRQGHLQCAGTAGRDLRAILVDAVSFHRERVRGRAVVD